MKNIILAALLVIGSVNAFAGFTQVTAASLTKNMIKYPGYNLTILQNLEADLKLPSVGDVKAQLILIEENKVKSVLLSTNDGVNNYYFKVADDMIVKSLKSIKQSVSGSIIEIDVELADGKTAEINVMLMSTEREDQSGQNTLKVFHVVNLMDKFGYKRK